jgi:uncharacterized protein (DUF2147 family)
MWSGQIYNAEDGKTYTGNITAQGPNALKLEGGALGGLICKGPDLGAGQVTARRMG